jgi:hypothetical protein
MGVYALTAIIAATGFVGTVEKIENQLVEVIIALHDSEQVIQANIPAVMIPCEVSAGDVIHIQKTEEVTEIRCTQPPPIPSTTTLEIQIDPLTGEMRYVLKGMKIELQ